MSFEVAPRISIPFLCLKFNFKERKETEIRSAISRNRILKISSSISTRSVAEGYFHKNLEPLLFLSYTK